ncbi:MAG: energy-coupling factor transporter transmembrane protein EcfT, partial [Desulfobacteraceae bacterium]|nr:energy-coupling factor transporter transmembrane protein EcfT [Desulfobacteraceae bacterium]
NLALVHAPTRLASGEALMAAGLTFHYFPCNSVLHRWDARCKFFGLLVLALGILCMDTAALLIVSLLFAAALAASGIPVRSLAADMKSWALFLLIIFIFQAFSLNESGPAPPAWWPSDYAQLFPALVTIWRLTLMLCFGMLFTMVTRPRELQDGIIWMLMPFPFLPARRIALMVSLMLRFLPLILDQADEVNLATRARLGNRRRNPVLRMKYFVLPLFRRSLKRADDLALALAARGYRDDLPFRCAPLPMKHFASLMPLALLIAFLAGWIPSVASASWNSFVALAFGVLS